MQNPIAEATIEKHKETRDVWMSQEQERYCCYRLTCSAVDSYKAAYHPDPALPAAAIATRAARVENNRRVQDRLRALRAEAATPFVLDRQKVIRKMLNLAFADVSEIAEHRRAACRYCYGEGHEYQWRSEREYALACDAAIARQEVKLPSCEGGFGYRDDLPPAEDCTECNGQGEARMFVADTREISTEARDLIKGYKLTRWGPEIQIHDQAQALRDLAEMLGLTRSDLTQMLATMMGARPAIEVEGKTVEQLSEAYLTLIEG